MPEVRTKQITVRKSAVNFGAETFRGIKFRITSNAEERVEFRLIEDLPDDIRISDIGLNPDYHADKWDNYPEQNRLVFKDQIDPGEQITTLWGIRSSSPNDLQSLLTEPTIEVTPPSEPGDHYPPGSIPDDEPDTPEAESLDTFWENAGQEEDPTIEEKLEQSWEFVSDSPVQRDQERVTTQVVSEIQSGAVSDEELDELREALFPETPESHRIRIRWLQSQVSELMAYAQEFENIIDEQGSPRELIEEFNDKLRSIEGRLDELESEQPEVEEFHANVRERIAVLESRLEGVEGTGEAVHRLQYQMEDLEPDELTEHVVELDAELASVRDDLIDLKEEFEELDTWRSQLAELVGSLGESPK